MCLILFAAGAHPAFPLIVAANRDEAYARPSAPAAFWHDQPPVYAGRDLEQGGTWLGIARNGRFAAITNYRQGYRLARPMRSRGELTRDFLVGFESAPSYIGKIMLRADQYNGFSLIAGDPETLYFYSNRGSTPQRIPPGVHGLSNHLLDEPWPKVLRGISVLKDLMDAPESEIVQSLSAVLADRTPAPDALLPATGVEPERERALSAAFIAGESYGTRASTILLVSLSGGVFFRETRFGAAGELLGASERRFTLECEAQRFGP